MGTALRSISIVIPAYNAGSSIASTLEEVFAFVHAERLMHEVIVVDDASLDHTPRIVAERFPTVRLLRHPANRGKGGAVRTGMLAAGGDWAMFLDADHSTHIEQLRLVAERAQDADVIIGSRRSAQSTSAIARPLHRRMLGDLFPKLTSHVLPAVSDTQCGFKVFKRWTVGPIFGKLTISGFAFDVEALLLADRLGAVIREVPVSWNNPRESTLNVRRDAPRMLADVIRVGWSLRRSGARSRALGREGAELRSGEGSLLPRVMIAPAGRSGAMLEPGVRAGSTPTGSR